MKVEEQELLQIIKTNNSVDYAKMIKNQKSYFLLKQLSDLRSNIISWLPISEGDRVLELCSSYGAITSYLVSQGAYVDCVEKSDTKNLINKERIKHEKLDLTHVAYFCEDPMTIMEELGGGYQYIFILEPIAASEMQLKDLLQKALKLLEPQGEIILVLDNVYGLKYWAGCVDPYTREFNKGLEGYVDYDGKRAFSKRQIENVIERLGVERGEFFYPYPDRYFPLQIFSDARLPQEGELTNNFRNFDEDRMVVFDETRVYNHLIKDDKFPDFSNVYLVKIGNSGRNENVIYSKFSNDRDRRFQIRTDIVQKDMEFKVRKCPASDFSDQHIQNMYFHYEMLEKEWENTVFCVNKTSINNSKLEHEFLKGSSIETILDKLLIENEMDGLRSVVEDFCNQLKGLAHNKFVPTVEFDRIFGTAYQDKEELLCWNSMEVTDVDMIFPNILVQDKVWNVIDYEWTFTFPIPVEYVIYRSVHYYQEGQREKRIKKNFDLYEVAGISPVEKQIFAQMERQFQIYLTRGHIPIWKLYEEMSGDTFFPAGAFLRFKEEKIHSAVTVIYHGQFGNLEKTFYSNKNDHGCYMLQIPVEHDVQYLQIVLYPQHCYMEMKGVFAVGDAVVPLAWQHCGVTICRDKVVFPSDQVEVYLEWNERDENELYMEWYVEYQSYEQLMHRVIVEENAVINQITT